MARRPLPAARKSVAATAPRKIVPRNRSKGKAPAGSGAAAAAAAASNAAAAPDAAPSSSSSSSPSYPSIDEAKMLVAELCADFYRLGWVSGTGGGLSMRAGPGGESVVMAPSGVQKERMAAADMFVLRTADGEVVSEPASSTPQRPLKLSECAPLFMSAYELRGAGAVVHSHSLSAVAATMIQGEDSPSFRATHLEMCKGIDGHGFHSVVEVPIIENTARECELTGRLREAIEAYPRSNAVLVRRHGVYVWGSTWQRAKAQAETYDYLFEAALRLKQAAGVDVSRPPPGSKEPPLLPAAEQEQDEAAPAAKKARVSSLPPPPKAVVLDIEGTVMPISYVKSEMFPFALKRFAGYLSDNFGSEEVQAQLRALAEEQRADASRPPRASSAEGGPWWEKLQQQENGNGDAALSAEAAEAAATARKSAVVEGAVAYLEALTAADVKSTALKAIQGSIWHDGFLRGELEAPLFADVPGALERWSSSGGDGGGNTKVFIYSSGSRRAQMDLFAHTNAGDLSGRISGYFDTTSGAKVNASSYQNIFRELGLPSGSSSPSDVLFVTDILAEAAAAKEAGWRVVLASRPGNAPLPAGHGFPVVADFGEEIF